MNHVGRTMGKTFFWLTCSSLFLMTSARLEPQTRSRPEIEQHYKNAQEALRAKQDAIAIREFREILHLDPRNASAHANLGGIAFTGKDYVQASQEFRAALKLQPSLWNAQAFLGMSELRLRHRAQAQPLLEESFKNVQDADLKTKVGMDLITLYYHSNDLNQAVDVVRALARIRPEAPDVLYTAYRTYSDLAARSLSALARVAPDSAEMHQILAQALVSQDNFPGAIAQYRKALETDPQLPGVHFELGQVILANSQEEPARKEAEKELALALAADPANAGSEYMLGEIEWLRSNPQGALEHYSHALEFRPDFVDSHIAAGKALTNLGRPAEALAHLLEAVRLDPQNEAVHYRLAQALRRLGRKQDAEREESTFRKLRDSHQPVRALFEQVQERPAMHQTIGPDEPQ